MYIFGASGHARAIIDILDPKVKISGIFDDNSKIEEILGFPVSGPVPDNFKFDAPLFIAIGNNEGRKFLFEKFSPRTNFGTIVHESAIISRYTSIAEGTVVMEGAIVKVNSHIGKQVIVNTGASVDHDCEVGDFVHIAPQATLCGGALIGEGTIVGANSTILPGVKVGKWCTIAAGAVISRNLPDGAVQKGYG
ncbi:acetyltransferase [Cyclobacterium marinum]|uniref:Sugar O-acyltransferase, sialic acid O-acetyltransferase NeuD family n=1 Tax=Cyclobacterium marinum (strain ATCC 25205 / DSM 745 / LMG 13164 / NCIMB 1802) TaxID=880070 RepID=G0J680_CYCMS|nr:acetyltransferase [Cyclobacterium marinum]AEL26832.1 sugar O-acyltransferase, sialic acid O-acetyltransferase NeuD family [Cyclobacterium marinum DSM 745]